MMTPFEQAKQELSKVKDKGLLVGQTAEVTLVDGTVLQGHYYGLQRDGTVNFHVDKYKTSYEGLLKKGLLQETGHYLSIPVSSISTLQGYLDVAKAKRHQKGPTIRDAWAHA